METLVHLLDVIHVKRFQFTLSLLWQAKHSLVLLCPESCLSKLLV